MVHIIGGFFAWHPFFKPYYMLVTVLHVENDFYSWMSILCSLSLFCDFTQSFHWNLHFREP